jgi:hypothetical protein
VSKIRDWTSGDDFDILAVGSFSDKIRFDGAEGDRSMDTYAEPWIPTVDVVRKRKYGRRSFECSIEDISEISCELHVLLLILANRDMGSSGKCIRRRVKNTIMKEDRLVNKDVGSLQYRIHE